MSSSIVQQVGGELTVSSEIIAGRTDNQHASVLRIVRDKITELEQFGTVGFEIRPLPGGGNPVQVAHLNEPQATLLMTFMRNSEVVVSFKVELVKQFYAMRQVLAGTGSPKTLAQRSLELLGELTAEVERQQEQITALVPRASAWDDLASGEGTYSVGDAAKILQQAGIRTGRDRLFEFLSEIGWVFRQSGRWHARQSAVDTGRLLHKPQSHRHPETGDTVLDPPQVRVTVKGLQQLRERLLPSISELVALTG